jgi:hypothetical protein
MPPTLRQPKRALHDELHAINVLQDWWDTGEHDVVLRRPLVHVNWKFHARVEQRAIVIAQQLETFEFLPRDRFVAAHKDVMRVHTLVVHDDDGEERYGWTAFECEEHWGSSMQGRFAPRTRSESWIRQRRVVQACWGAAERTDRRGCKQLDSRNLGYSAEAGGQVDDFTRQTDGSRSQGEAGGSRSGRDGDRRA